MIRHYLRAPSAWFSGQCLIKMHTPEGSLIGNGERPDLLSVSCGEGNEDVDEAEGAEDDGECLKSEDAVTSR